MLHQADNVYLHCQIIVISQTPNLILEYSFYMCGVKLIMM